MTPIHPGAETLPVERDDRHWCSDAGPLERRVTSDTIGGRFDRMADDWPDHDALVSCRQRLRYSYRDLQREVDICARGLLALGMQRHDRIGLWAPASAESVIATLAAVKVGAQVIFLDPACGAMQLHAALTQYGVSLLVVTPSFAGVDTLGTLGAICPELSTSPRGQLHSGPLPLLRVVVALGVKRPSGAYNWGDLLALGEGVRPVTLRTRQAQLDAMDLIAVVPSCDAGEGLQGQSMSHQHLLSLAVLGSGGVALTSRDRLCLALPLSHPLSLGIEVLGCLVQGATLVLPAAIADPATVQTAIGEERCTVVRDHAGAYRLAAGRAGSA
jgi:fatty-acyl-CoA synthase